MRSDLETKLFFKGDLNKILIQCLKNSQYNLKNLENKRN